MSTNNLVADKAAPVPQFEGDTAEWAYNLTAYLTNSANSVDASALSLPVKDTAGRTIIDKTGFYLYDSFDTLFISPDIIQIDTTHLVDAAITTAKLANLAVDTAKLADLAIEAAKLADSAVTATKIANAAVGSAAIANAAIGTAHIANAAITSALIGDAQIVTAKIDDLAVNNAKIANAAIDSGKIANAAITNAHIVNAAIDNLKIVNSLNSADFAFTPGVSATGWQIFGAQSGIGSMLVNQLTVVDNNGIVLLESGATATGTIIDDIGTAQTTADTANTAAGTAQTAANTAQTAADSAQTTANTANTAAATAQTAADGAQSTADTAITNAATGITNAAAAQADADQAIADAASALAAANSAEGSPVFYQTTTPATTGPDGSVWIHETTKVMHMLRSGVWENIGFSEQITSANISTYIAGAAIGTAQIGNAAIGTAQIQNLAVTTALIDVAAVTTAKIANAAITTALIDNAAITTALIADAAITNAKIADATITTAKIGDAEITSAKIGNTIQSTNFEYTPGVSAAGWRITGTQSGGGVFEGTEFRLYDSTGNLVLNPANSSGSVFTEISSAALTADWASLSNRPVDADLLNSFVSLVGLGFTGATNANYITNTNELTDGANLGGTAAWTSVTGKPVFGLISALDQIDGTYITDGAIVTDLLAADAVVASKIAANSIDVSHLNISTLHSDVGNNSGLSIVFDPYSETPMDMTRSDGTSVFSIQVVDGTEKAIIDGVAGDDFITGIDSISTNVLKSINKYYLGDGDTAAATTGVTQASGSGAAVALTVNTGPEGKVSLSYNFTASDTYFGEASNQNWVKPDWTVEIRRNTSTGAIIHSQNFVGSAYNTLEPEAGIQWFGGYNITAAGSYVDEAAPASGTEVYYVRLLRNSGEPTLLTRNKAVAEAPSFETNALSTSGSQHHWRDKDTGYTRKSGTVSVGGNSSTTVNFTNSFTTLYSATATALTTNTGSDNGANLWNVSANALTIYNPEGTTRTCHWQADGYTA